MNIATAVEAITSKDRFYEEAFKQTS